MTWTPIPPIPPPSPEPVREPSLVASRVARGVVIAFFGGVLLLTSSAFTGVKGASVPSVDALIFFDLLLLYIVVHQIVRWNVPVGAWEVERLGRVFGRPLSSVRGVGDGGGDGGGGGGGDGD